MNWRAPEDRIYTDWIGLFDKPLKVGQTKTGNWHTFFIAVVYYAKSQSYKRNPVLFTKKKK